MSESSETISASMPEAGTSPAATAAAAATGPPLAPAAMGGAEGATIGAIARSSARPSESWLSAPLPCEISDGNDMEIDTPTRDRQIKAIDPGE